MGVQRGRQRNDRVADNGTRIVDTEDNLLPNEHDMGSQVSTILHGLGQSIHHSVGSPPKCLARGLPVRTWRLRGLYAQICGPYIKTHATESCVAKYLNVPHTAADGVGDEACRKGAQPLTPRTHLEARLLIHLYIQRF